MVGTGLLPWAVVDRFKAQAWAGLLKGLTVRDDIAINEGGDIAWAIRKDSPGLRKELAEFVKTHKIGTEFGNDLRARYFKTAKPLKNALANAEAEKFKTLRVSFQKYGGQFSIDPVLLAAQGYQESELDQACHNASGATGIMQIKPSTAKEKPIEITGVAASADTNIHAGSKYLRYLAGHLCRRIGHRSTRAGVYGTRRPTMPAPETSSVSATTPASTVLTQPSGSVTSRTARPRSSDRRRSNTSARSTNTTSRTNRCVRQRRRAQRPTHRRSSPDCVMPWCAEFNQEKRNWTMKLKSFASRIGLGLGAFVISILSAQAQVPLSTYMDSKGFIDVQALTCAQLANTYQEDADYLAAWYSGWYNGLAQSTSPMSREPGRASTK